MKTTGIVVVVTGGGSGLGLATAEYMLSLGNKVAVIDLRFDDTLNPHPTNFIKVNGSVTSKKDIDAAFKTVVEKFGRIDAVVNCAGVISIGLLVAKKKQYEANENEFEKVLKINVIGTFIVSKAYVDLKIAHNWDSGVIINISSVASEDGQNGQTIYSASKGAINGMTLPMARELGKYKIRVVTIMPGPIRTKMGDKLTPKAEEALTKSSALGRYGEPIEFAQFVKAIIENEYLTGCNLRLDGGTRTPKL
jgi:NAD(P)-dependent dehydrogenase (short-subunit alcohol dehydrogenase family)